MYFAPFIPEYSRKTAHLSEMTHKKFDWDESAWTKGYKQAFEAFKGDILKAVELHHPDYELEWILRCDASELGVGAVLMQVHVQEDGTRIYQPIVFISMKFSDVAARWHVMEQECYALFYAVRKLEYYLKGKKFILETDHANLQWMYQSEAKKIVRQMIYLQGFDYTLRHIKGTQNVVADWQSRLFLLHVATGAMTQEEWNSRQAVCGIEPEPSEGLFLVQGKPKHAWVSADALIESVHNDVEGHKGWVRTWQDLNKEFPGHHVTQQYVAEYIRTCKYCQKLRLDMRTKLPVPLRSIRPIHHRELVGVDTLKVTPPDKFGHVAIHVVRKVSSRIVGLYPVKDESALGMATAIFLFCVTYGLFDVLISDPGSNITAEVLQQLISWMGIKSRFSLVDRHESNFVEPANKEVLRFLAALVHTKRVVQEWGSPVNMALVAHIMNSQKSSESDISPYHFEFGTEDMRYFRLPETTGGTDRRSKFVEELDGKLRKLREVASEFNQASQDKRINKQSKAGSDPDSQNHYQPGSYVLYDKYSGGFKPTKMTPKFVGPYEVLSRHKTDYECKHVAMGNIEFLHMDRLKPFFGSKQDAWDMAMLDHDQHAVDRIVAHRGNPLQRCPG